MGDETPLEQACRDAELSNGDLWLRYFALGGTASPGEVRAYVHGGTHLTRAQNDVVIQAMNERYMELERPNRLPYAADV
ncbi:MAG: hypothetical protein JO086_06060 [Acidimicrobiia bacterium]|nr:hypothetical protein [Acidimicrobiia bacterium]